MVNKKVCLSLLLPGEFPRIFCETEGTHQVELKQKISLCCIYLKYEEND